MNRDEIEQGCIVSVCGSERIRLIYLDIPSIDTKKWPAGSALDFGDLRWEVLRNDQWEIRRRLGEEDFAKILGEDAYVTQVDSFSPESGSAVLQFSTQGPIDSLGGIWYLFTWRDWDLVGNRERRFIEIADDIFAPPIDAFASKCEDDAQRQHKHRIAEQDGDDQSPTRSDVDA